MNGNWLGRRARHSLVALAFLGSLCSTAVASYTQVVFFGDSLSDTGNLYAATGIPVSPPYYQGSFSNGPLWTEIFAGSLGLSATPSSFGGTNFAWAGATVIDYGRPMPEIPQELGQYFALSGGAADPNALYVVLGGANDVTDVLQNPATAAGNIVLAARAIDGMVDALYMAGARNILVGNLSDVGRTPLAVAGGPAVVAGATALTNLFNATLASLLDADEAADANLRLDRLDFYASFNSVLANPALYGFDNVTAPCKVGPLGVPGAVCATPDTYLFWDTFNPSAHGHQLIAEVASTAVPEPAALALMVVALMMMLCVRRPRSGRGVAGIA
jgi:phospholipase/lecithinase/hemolysin